MAVPICNFVGLLQEKCQVAHIPLPEYVDLSIENSFKFSCKLKDWICHGTGASKKISKQNAAKEMLEIIKDEKLTADSCEKSFDSSKTEKSAVSKLTEFCSKEKISRPLFSELPTESDNFLCECTLKDFAAVGEGKSKKEAKENAARKVSNHFDVQKYFDNVMKYKERMITLSTLQTLSMLCQEKHLPAPTYQEENVKENNVTKYRVTCFVGDLALESGLSHSKKAAKYEAASLLLEALKNNTPELSPATEKEVNTRTLEKRKSSSPHPEEPVSKPLKIDFDK